MTKIWGHRGCRGPNNPPENSLAAFEAAIAQGADGIELDVFATLDNELVVIHDKMLEDRTNGTGKISTKKLTELKKFVLKKNGSNEFSDQPIPTLNEVLDLVKAKAKPDFVVNIEMKSGIADTLADVIRKRLIHDWKRDNFLVASFDLNGLQDFNRELPAIPIGALFAGKSEPWNITENTLHKKLMMLGDFKPATINLTLPSMTPHVIDLIKKNGAKPVAWTFNELPPAQLDSASRAAMKSYLTQGHTLITDFPAEVRAII